MIPEKKILFVINPASGNRKGKPDEKMIAAFFKGSNINAELEFTKKQGHASEITDLALKENYNGVIAVGGDGTVNEVARVLNGTDCALGIMPFGSGNGLARHHKISFDPTIALQAIKNFKLANHDAVKINDYISFNVSGIGFDAHVAHLFGKDGKRGFSSYLKLVVREFSSYKQNKIRVTNESVQMEYDSMLTAIANGSQFGNNARIAPVADTNDGKADITIIKKMRVWNMPYFAYKVFRGEVASSDYSTILQTESLKIESDSKLPLHIDGEPSGYSSEFKIQTIKRSLKLIIP